MVIHRIEFLGEGAGEVIAVNPVAFLAFAYPGIEARNSNHPLG